MLFNKPDFDGILTFFLFRAFFVLNVNRVRVLNYQRQPYTQKWVKWAAYRVSLPGFLPASLIFTMDELVNSPVILWLKSVAYYYIPHVPHQSFRHP